MGLLTALTHALVSRPAIYDAIQAAAGSRTCYGRLRAMLPPMAGERVLDVGGGTGLSLSVLDPGAEYVAADIDPAKLLVMLSRRGALRAVCADAARLPMADASFDVGLLVFVCHHLDDAKLDAALREVARVCNGPVLVMDPIWVPGRWRGRLLWRYDEGRYPRTVGQLSAAIEKYFAIDAEDDFAVHHAYHIWRAVPLRR
jgi:ubiquinone/menaquinone biosynthesis C-methylase UbiE